MEFIIKIGQFLLSLSLLIVLHELGHFIPAKAFKTRVEKFYLFFDVKYSLFKKKIGETVYGIGWLPLGGYVKISGMIDESMDTEQMAQEPQPWEFRSKPAWQRLIIMLGGVFVNFLLALVIYIVASFVYGDTDISASSLKDGFVIENPILTKIGFKTGDKITKVDGEPVTYESDIRRNIIGANNVTIKRGEEEKTIELPIDFLGQLSSSDDRSLFDLRQPFIVEKIMDTSLNKSVDLQKGDIFKSINGKPAEYFDQVAPILEDTKGQTINVTIQRGNTTINRDLKVDQYAKLDVVTTRSLKTFEELGYLKIITKNYSFGESFGVGFKKFTSQITSYFGQLSNF